MTLLRIVITVALTVLFSSSFASADNPPLTDTQILDQEGPAVVSLVVRAVGGGEVDRGSGFIVSPEGDILTVAHVRPSDPSQYMEATIGQSAGVTHRLTLIGMDIERDVALYRLDQSQVCRPSLPLSVDRPFVTDQLTVLGFPKGLGLTPLTARVANLYGPDGLIIVDGNLTPGTSGGPVIRRDGRVMGIVRGGHPSSTQTNHVIPIAYASGLLETIGRWPPQQSTEVYPIECYRSCAVPENGIDHWESEVPWSAQSGWLGGGNNRTDVCNSLKAGWEAANPGHYVEVKGMDEANNKDLFGHVEYKYICNGVARFGPAYRVSRSRSCGLPPAP
jgi:S1-C subfamily serine protease